MKLRWRTIAKLGLFLLAGAMVNVGVAWGLFGVEWRRTAESGIAFYKATAARASVGPAAWGEPVNQSANDAFGVTWRLDFYVAESNSPAGNAAEPSVQSVLSVSAGLPMRSMRGLALAEAADQPAGRLAGSVISRYVGAWPLDSSRDWLMLPYAIVPLGFLVNTAVYAAALALIGLGMRQARRSRRLTRGLCPRCKYPLADLPTCPECGETIRQKAAAG